MRSVRQACDDGGERFLDFHGSLGRLHGFIEVGLHGDGRRTVAAPEDRILGTDLDVTDLTQGDHASRAARQGQLAESRGVEALGACAARHHVHRTDIFPNLSHRDPG